jgi:serine/threonine protein kinase/Tol biopolymer transport system component
MALSAGTRLGVYEVVSSLGEGGMGEVYRAKDSLLKREVALKVLPSALAGDLDRLSRFQREAELLAALNHPNIAHIYGVAEAGDVRGLVMELVEGPTLAERITRGAIPPAEALPLARQLADALEYAHERGIVHRDLKPANIKVTDDGVVKVLDFGLAKALDPGGPGSKDTSAAATMTSPAITQAGIILGTAAYMSPEQARGKPVDKRADIWAFGVVLFEMLTGRAAFPGETMTDVLAGIVHKDPDWAALPAGTPRHLRELLRRCLQKDPRQRLRDLGDAQLGSDAPVETAPAAQPAPWWPPERRSLVIGVVAGTLVTAAALWTLLPRASSLSSGAETLRLSISAPAGTRFDVANWTVPALTPDGKSVIFAARGPDGSKLYVRNLSDYDARVLPGTDDALPMPVIDPTGQRVLFVTTATELKRVAISGSTDSTFMAPAVDWFHRMRGWRGDAIAVSSPTAVWELPGGASTWKQLDALDASAGERTILDGVVAPTGLILLSVETDSGIRVAAIEPGGKRRWVEGLSGIVRAFVPPNSVIVQQETRLALVSIDMDSLRVTAEQTLQTGAPATSLVAAGGDSIAYFLMQRGKGRRLVLVDRGGNAVPIPADSGEYRGPRFSADGRTIAAYGATSTEDFAVMTIDVETGRQLSVSTPDAVNPTWDAAANTLLFSAGLQLPQQVLRWVAGGSSEPRVAFTTPYRSVPVSVFSDGSALLEAMNPGQDVVFVDPEGRPRSILNGPRAERNPKVSSDGKWIAYQSNESGRFEIYVQPWPALDRKYPVSVDGGAEPVWSRSGHELYFRKGRHIWVSRITTTPEFRADTPKVLFDAGRFSADPYGDPSFDVDPKGRFIMIEDDPEARIELRVELNALRARVK